MTVNDSDPASALAYKELQQAFSALEKKLREPAGSKAADVLEYVISQGQSQSSVADKVNCHRSRIGSLKTHLLPDRIIRLLNENPRDLEPVAEALHNILEERARLGNPVKHNRPLAYSEQVKAKSSQTQSAEHKR